LERGRLFGQESTSTSQILKITRETYFRELMFASEVPYKAEGEKMMVEDGFLGQKLR